MIDPLAVDRQTIQAEVSRILDDMTRDWDFQYSGAIGGDTCLVADLGFQSIDFVMVIVSLEETFHRKNLPFESLLVKNGIFVGDVTVDQITEMLTKCLQRAEGGA
jgi:acyl carrier protein